MTVELLSLDQAAQRAGVPTTRIRQWVRDGSLLMVTDEQGRRCVPGEFLSADGVVKGLPGVITLLRDAGYADGDVVHWLFRPDESLPGTPIAALRENRGTEVKRRAQASGF